MSLADALAAATDVYLLRASLKKSPPAPDALARAVPTATIAVLRTLLEAGAAPAGKDKAGLDALDRAIESKRRNVVDLLAPHFPKERIEAALKKLPYHPRPVRPQKSQAAKEAAAPHPFFQYVAQNEAVKKSPPESKRLLAAIKKGDIQTVRAFLESGLDPEAPADDGLGGETPLTAAIFANQPDIIRALTDAGADPDAGFPQAHIFLAIESKRLDAARALAEAGADLTAISHGETPLTMAIDRGHAATVADLLRLGADPNLTTSGQGRYPAKLTPLQVASTHSQDAANIIPLLLKYGAAEPNPAALFLCTAAAAGDLSAIKQHLAAGADVNAHDSTGRTPLVAAAAAGKLAVAKLLLASGANPNLAAKKSFNEGITPLIATIFGNHLKIAELLVESGADPAAKAANGYTALALAKQFRAKKLVEFLTTATPTSAQPAKTGTDLRGVPTFDVNDSCVLVDAPIDAVADAFASHVSAKKWLKDVLENPPKLTARCYLVLSLVGMKWTAIVRASAPVRDYPSIDNARAVSAATGARAIYVGNSDTGGVTQYAVFDLGQLVEFFDYGSTEGKPDAPATIAKSYGVDLATLSPQSADRKVFASSLRTVDIKSIKNDLDFVNDFVKSQDALAPMFPEGYGDTGDEAEFAFEDLTDDDIARIDFISAAPSKR